MSAGSGASNLGYGNIIPNSNVNPAMVNVDGSTYAGGFGSNEIPSSSHSMMGAVNNVVAASGNWTGGRRTKRRVRFSKRNNISKLYRMRKSMKKSMRKGASRRRRSNYRRKSYRRMCTYGGRRHGRRHGRKPIRRTRRQRGGYYIQYESNVPYTPGYSLGGPLAASASALANPPPYQPYDDCQDNYNHYAATQGQ